MHSLLTLELKFTRVIVKSLTMLKKVVGVLCITALLVISACNDDKDSKPNTIDNCLTASSTNLGEPIPGEYIVTFTGDGESAGRSVQKAARVFQAHNISSNQISQFIEGDFAHYVMKLSPEEAYALKTDKEVLRVENDRIISVCACFTVLEPRTVTWNVNMVGYGDGQGKTAWIMDTGIDFNHPDLNVDETRSRVFIDDETSADDDNGHGTHIAGIIGAKNNTIGTLGVASGANLVSLKILDSEGNGRLSTAIRALSYIRSNAHAGDVVNISISIGEISETLETEIRAIANKGVFFAIAAGNEGKPANSFSPARMIGKNIYTVSAVDSLNRFASFSNYGNDAVDFAAPGVRIISTYFNGKYAIMSGTSQATPHVAALLLINNGKINSEAFAENDPDGTPDPIAHQ